MTKLEEARSTQRSNITKLEEAKSTRSVISKHEDYLKSKSSRAVLSRQNDIRSKKESEENTSKDGELCEKSVFQSQRLVKEKKDRNQSANISQQSSETKFTKPIFLNKEIKGNSEKEFVFRSKSSKNLN